MYKCYGDRITMKHFDPKSVDFVIYHADCIDGFGAAYAAWKLLGNDAKYYPAKHGDPPPDVTGKTVAIVDFSYSRQTIEKLQTSTKNLIILDHHKTARDELEKLDCAIFDMSHSGAMLSWMYFHPDVPPPEFIRMIEDADLWRWSLSNTRNFVAAFYNEPYIFDVYDSYNDKMKLGDIIVKGANIREHMDVLVKKSCEKSFVTNFCGYKTRIVNSPNFQSDIGNVLVSQFDCDVGFIWYYDHAAKRCIVSLRSCKDDVDVSKLAQKFGGGGHPRAAGFQWVNDIEKLLN